MGIAEKNKLSMGGDEKDVVSVTRTYERTEKKPSIVVRETMADIKNTTPSSVDIPLEEHVEIDALDEFISETSTQINPSLEFEMEDYLVTITTDKVVISI